MVFKRKDVLNDVFAFPTLARKGELATPFTAP